MTIDEVKKQFQKLIIDWRARKDIACADELEDLLETIDISNFINEHVFQHRARLVIENAKGLISSLEKSLPEELEADDETARG